jgi:uncharacterized protein (DUF58 family)
MQLPEWFRICSGPSRRLARQPDARPMLTRTGRNTLLAVIVLYCAAFALGYPELAAPAIAGGLALGIALITVARRARLQVTMTVVPSRVSRGQRVTANISVRNESGSRSPGFRLSLPHGTQRSLIAVRPLGKHRHREISLALDCDHRGLIQIGPIAIDQGDIFGLCHRTQLAGSPVTVRVHPVVHPLALPSATRLRQADGAAFLRNSDGGVSFHSLRKYVPGDDLRYVHWLKSASTAGAAGDLLVRRHVDAGDASATVLLDTSDGAYRSHSGAAEPFEMAVDFAASILVACARNGYPVRLHTTGGVNVIADPGRDGARRVLDALASVQPGGEGLMSTVGVVSGPRGGRHTATLTLITGPRTDVPGPVLHRLCRSHGQVITVQIGSAGAPHPVSRRQGIPGASPRLHAFRAATAAEAAAQWAVIAAPRRSRAW